MNDERILFVIVPTRCDILFLFLVPYFSASSFIQAQRVIKMLLQRH